MNRNKNKENKSRDKKIRLEANENRQSGEKEEVKSHTKYNILIDLLTNLTMSPGGKEAQLEKEKMKSNKKNKNKNLDTFSTLQSPQLTESPRLQPQDTEKWNSNYNNEVFSSDDHPNSQTIKQILAKENEEKLGTGAKSQNFPPEALKKPEETTVDNSKELKKEKETENKSRNLDHNTAGTSSHNKNVSSSLQNEEITQVPTAKTVVDESTNKDDNIMETDIPMSKDDMTKHSNLDSSKKPFSSIFLLVCVLSLLVNFYMITKYTIRKIRNLLKD